MNIAQNLLTRARSIPDAPAVSANGHSMTFAALADRVQCIAGGLATQWRMDAQQRVVIYMENRPEFLETLFACWVAGLCVVPVNAKLHAREVAHIVTNAEARLVLTSEKLAAELSDLLAKDAAAAMIVVGSADYQALLAAQPAACAPVADADPAWIFYTSGTTGPPKGAILSHASLFYMALAYYADIEHVQVGDTQLHAAPLSHGSGLYSLPHLFAGGHQVILQGFQANEILDGFQRYPAVSMFAAPTMLTRLVQAANGRDECAGNLRTLIYGGGPMYVNDLLRALDTFGLRLYQVFGQGESPMTITGLSKPDHVGQQDAAHLARLASSGVPRTGMAVRVVDDAGVDVADDAPGEIIVRGPAVMSAYWNNPTATAKALRDGWLWTGDIGSLSADGYLTLRDRSKDVIISGGHNIYPREIEEVLLKHPAVLECSVISRPHDDWGEEPVAFVVVREGAAASAEALDALCLDHIARFKRPRDYRFIDALPKNSYGKILKTDLRSALDAGDG